MLARRVIWMRQEVTKQFDEFRENDGDCITQIVRAVAFRIARQSCGCLKAIIIFETTLICYIRESDSFLLKMEF